MKRIDSGLYESRDGRVKIERVDRHSEGMQSGGWHLHVDGEYWSTFATKKEAIEALAEES